MPILRPGFEVSGREYDKRRILRLAFVSHTKPIESDNEDFVTQAIVTYPTQACLIGSLNGGARPYRAEANVFKSARPTAASKLTPSLDYMRAHLNEPMRIATLCALAGLSPSRFFEVFKTVMGDTPLNWIIRARMQRAGELLAASGLQVKEVAWEVGYQDPFYFSRLFKSVHGVSPSLYRKRAVAGTGSELEQRAQR